MLCFNHRADEDLSFLPLRTGKHNTQVKDFKAGQFFLVSLPIAQEERHAEAK